MRNDERSGGRLAMAGVALAIAMLSGCVTENEDMAERYIAEMDALPPEERVPNWDAIKALMLREPPSVGEEAPDFALENRDGSGSVRLSDFRGERPVVLIFGSWT